MQKQRSDLFGAEQVGDLLAVRHLLGCQSAEHDVALDRLERTPSILAVHRQVQSLQFTVDPLRHGRQQVDFIDAQFAQRQQADQRPLVDLLEVLTFDRLLAAVDDHLSHMVQRDLFAFSDSRQLVVDQAAVLGVQVDFDVIGKRLAEAVQHVPVSGQVGLVEFGEFEVDLKAVDVPLESTQTEIGIRLVQVSCGSNDECNSLDSIKWLTPQNQNSFDEFRFMSSPEGILEAHRR